MPQDFQLQDADLTSIGGIANDSTGFLVKTAPNTWMINPNIALGSNNVIEFTGSGQSTSVNTGAVVITNGGLGVSGAIFANQINGEIRLNRRNTAQRVNAIVSRIGWLWVNTETGDIEYVSASGVVRKISGSIV